MQGQGKDASWTRTMIFCRRYSAPCWECPSIGFCRKLSTGKPFASLPGGVCGIIQAIAVCHVSRCFKCFLANKPSSQNISRRCTNKTNSRHTLNKTNILSFWLFDFGFFWAIIHAYFWHVGSHSFATCDALHMHLFQQATFEIRV